MSQLKLVGVSFHRAGKVFDFDAKEFDLAAGDRVIVETERGRALGTVVGDPRLVDREQAPPKLKGIQRQATEQDLEMAENNNRRGEEALRYCRQRVSERRMEMKLVRAEYLYDGSKIIFYFTADGRVDFRDLVRDLAQHFRTRIEMRQIGVRDEAKLVGGLGICGRELCCSQHLRDFAPVSVKMAKAQGLALNPTKISGQCGRLLCCLAYEYETYNELSKSLPKCGRKLRHQGENAEVIAVDVLSQKITLSLESGERTCCKVSELGGCPAKQNQNDNQAGGSERPRKSATDTPENKPQPRKRRSPRRAEDNRADRAQAEQRSGETAKEQQPRKTTAADNSPTRPGDSGEEPNRKPPSRRRRRPRRKPRSSDSSNKT